MLLFAQFESLPVLPNAEYFWLMQIYQSSNWELPHKFYYNDYNSRQQTTYENKDGIFDSSTRHGAKNLLIGNSARFEILSFLQPAFLAKGQHDWISLQVADIMSLIYYAWLIIISFG